MERNQQLLCCLLRKKEKVKREEEGGVLVMRPSLSRMRRVLTMPGWTQLAVTLAPISLRRSASTLVCRTLASLDSAYALVGSYGLLHW
jgi:hypothetical protein